MAHLVWLAKFRAGHLARRAFPVARATWLSTQLLARRAVVAFLFRSQCPGQPSRELYRAAGEAPL